MDNKLHKFISSTVSYHDFREAVNIARKLNCGIEISRFGRLIDIEDDFEKNKKEYKAILADFENEVTLHGFFSNLNIAAKDPLIAQISKKRYYQSLELASEFDVRTVVFHTCYNNLLKHKQYQQMFFLKNIEFYKEFVKNFEDLGIMVTIENVHEPNPEFIRNLVAAVNSPNLGTTIDIGHDATVSLQTDFFDKILPNLLPFAFTFLIYFLLRKKVNTTVLIVGIIIASIVFSFFGIL